MEGAGGNGGAVAAEPQVHIAAGNHGVGRIRIQITVNGAAGDLHAVAAPGVDTAHHGTPGHGEGAGAKGNGVAVLPAGDPAAGNGQHAVDIGGAVAVDGGLVRVAPDFTALDMDRAVGVHEDGGAFRALHGAAADIGGGIGVGLHGAAVIAVAGIDDGTAPDAQEIVVADGAVIAGGLDPAGANAVGDQQAPVGVNVENSVLAGNAVTVQTQTAAVAVIQDHGTGQNHILSQVVVAVVHPGGAIPGSPGTAGMVVRRTVAVTAAHRMGVGSLGFRSGLMGMDGQGRHVHQQRQGQKH